MVWVKLDDKFHGHRKTLALFDGPIPGDAIALWTLANSWCGDQLTDGQVPIAFVRRSGLDKRAADELVRVGLWDRTEDGYAFHDWLARNKSREQVEKERAAALDRKANGKRTAEEVRAHGRKEFTRTNSEPPSGVRETVFPPDPTRPDPEEDLSGGGGADLNGSSGAQPASEPPPPLPQPIFDPEQQAPTEQDARAVSAAWHTAMHRVELDGMHAFASWRQAYETIAIGLARQSDPDALPEARVALCTWFWSAPDGPVARKVFTRTPNPGHLAKQITDDIRAAGRWWESLSDAKRAAYLAPRRAEPAREAAQ